jgi:3'(2'), 5'-bisphosphate nucleotidase
MKIELGEALELAIRAALDAGKEIREVYKKEFDIEIKEDDSPVTEADIKANHAIMAVLKPAYPDVGFLTEEERDNHERLE